MVYDLRPISCRAHYVVAPDAGVCANRAVEPVITTLEMPDMILTAVARMLEGEAPDSLDGPRDHLLPRLLGSVLGVEPIATPETQRATLRRVTAGIARGDESSISLPEYHLESEPDGGVRIVDARTLPRKVGGPR